MRLHGLKNEYIFAVMTKLILVLFGMIDAAVIARYLGAELRGDLSYIQSIANIGFVIATMGIYTSYPYYRKKESPQVILNQIMSITIVMFIIYLVIVCITSFISSDNNLIYILLIIPILYYNKVVSFLWMIERPNKRNAVVLTFSLVKIVYFLFLYFCTESSLLWGISSCIIAQIFESIYFTTKLKFSFSFGNCNLYLIKKYVSYGFLPMIALLLTSFNYRLDVIMLSKSNNITMAEVGIYTIGMTLSEKALLVSDTVKEILLSKLAKGSGEKEVAKIMRLCFFVSVLMAILMTIFSKIFILFMYGEEYNGAEAVTNISVWGTIFMVFFKMISQYNVANHKQIYNVILLSFAVIVNVVLNTVFIPVWGTNGAALATAIGYGLSSFLFLFYFHKISGIRYSDLTLLNKSDIKHIITMFTSSK